MSATGDVAWTCPKCGNSGRVTITQVRCTCGTVSEGVWTVTFEGQQLYLTYVEYREFKRLVVDDQAEAEAMARLIRDRQDAVAHARSGHP